MPGSGLGKDRPRKTTEHYLNAESTESIPAGGIACFTMSGIQDGGTVHLPSNKASAALATQQLAGVAVHAVEAGEPGEFIVNGWIEELRVIRGARAASTVTYASSPAIAVGDNLIPEIVGNGVSRAGAAATGALNHFTALETAASSASAATTTSDTSTVRVDKLKAFIRLM